MKLAASRAAVAAATAFAFAAWPCGAALLVGSRWQNRALRDGGGAAEAKNRPVSKVITLLKDMLKQLGREADEDEEMYEKMSCWCQKNDKQKTEAVSNAIVHIADLGNKIDQLVAEVAKHGANDETLTVEVANGKATLATSKALRDKQLAEFVAEEASLQESIGALRAALVVLEKHSAGGAMLQTLRAPLDRNARAAAAAAVQGALASHGKQLRRRMSGRQLAAAAALVQDAQAGAGSAGYTPAAGQIFGILSQMLDDFTEDLKDAQAGEAVHQKDYQDLTEAKVREIEAGQERLTRIRREKALGAESLALHRVARSDSEATLLADEEFLRSLKQKCAMTDKEWEERHRTRQEEIQAVSEALAVLANDDAHDLFTRSFNRGLAPALLQRGGGLGGRLALAREALREAARRSGDPKMSALVAVTAGGGLDAFTKVKEAIDGMIAQLRQQAVDDLQHKDRCISENHTNSMEMLENEHSQNDKTASISDLGEQTTRLSDEMATLARDIADMEQEVQRAGEDTNKQSEEFKVQEQDQHDVIRLLHVAIQKLQAFYSRAPRPTPKPAAMPTVNGETFDFSDSFLELNAHKGGPAVIALLEQIAASAKTELVELRQSEQDSQTALADLKKVTGEAIRDKNREIVTKTSEKATADEQLLQAQESLRGLRDSQKALQEQVVALDQECRFLLLHFDVRKQARGQEVEALKQAKAILSGAGLQEGAE